MMLFILGVAKRSKAIASTRTKFVKYRRSTLDAMLNGIFAMLDEVLWVFAHKGVHPRGGQFLFQEKP